MECLTKAQLADNKFLTVISELKSVHIARAGNRRKRKKDTSMKTTFSSLFAISCAIAALTAFAPAAHAQKIFAMPVGFNDQDFTGQTGGFNFEGGETFVAEARAGNKASGGSFESQIIPGGTGATRDNSPGTTGRDVAWNGTARNFSLIVNHSTGLVTFQIAGSTGSGIESRTLANVPATTDLFFRAFANRTGGALELRDLVFTNTATGVVLAGFPAGVTANATNSPVYLRITEISNSFSLTGSINVVGSNALNSNPAVQFKGVAVPAGSNAVPEPGEYVFGGTLAATLAVALARGGRRRRRQVA